MDDSRYKFRAWDGDLMRYFDFSDIDGGSIGVPSWDNSLYLYGDTVALMQYTGLKDKNGKEIYEGDILRGMDYPFVSDGQENYRAIIAWDNDTVSFYSYPKVCSNRVRGGACDDYVFSDGKESARRFKIIGNVYENPEFLNQP